MRIRRLLLALCIGILPTLVIAAPSGASENEVPACIAELSAEYGLNEDGGEPTAAAIEEAKHESDAFKTALDKCNQSPSPMMPALPELIWGGLAFLIVFFGLAKVGFPAIKKGLADRSEKIRFDLESAENARASAETELADYRSQLAESREEAAGSLDESA